MDYRLEGVPIRKLLQVDDANQQNTERLKAFIIKELLAKKKAEQDAKK